MFMPLTATLAFACFALAAEPGAQSVPKDSPRIQVGGTTFTAEKVLFKSAEAGHFTCTLEGRAKLVLFGGDVEITADKIEVKADDQRPSSIVGTGSCTFTQVDDDEMKLSGDTLKLDDHGLSVTGNAMLQYGSGQEKTVLTADSITARDGTFETSGKATFRRGE